MAGNQGILVYCEADENKLASISIELLGVGNRLALELEQDLSAVIIGSEIWELASDAIAYGAKKIYIIDDPFLKEYLSDSYMQVMERVISHTQPQIVLFGQTHIGRDLTPRLAFRLKTAAVLDCIGLDVDPQTRRLLMTKPVYGGNALSVQVCECDPQIASVRSKVMPPSEKDEKRRGEIVNICADINKASVRTRVLDRKVETAASVKLEDARVIVSGGRGIGGPDGFKQLEELSKLLKGVVGASRPPCDNKWVSDSLQIGLTGKIVSPELYIAVALSGSSQHLSGCSGSKVIVAINKDPEANIFSVAHYGIAADWKKALPVFINRIKQLQG